MIILQALYRWQTNIDDLLILIDVSQSNIAKLRSIGPV
jgi:hypothetical protein